MHLDEPGDEWRRCCKLWMLVNCNLDEYFSAGRTDMMMERRRDCVRLYVCGNSGVGQSAGRLKHDVKARWQSLNTLNTKSELFCSIGTFAPGFIQFQIIRPKQLKVEEVVVFQGSLPFRISWCWCQRAADVPREAQCVKCCWCREKQKIHKNKRFVCPTLI